MSANLENSVVLVSVRINLALHQVSETVVCLTVSSVSFRRTGSSEKLTVDKVRERAVRSRCCRLVLAYSWEAGMNGSV